MKFKVEWQEWVYDEFDELEAINNEKPFMVEADSLEQAVSIAGGNADSLFKENRRYQDLSHGMFFLHIIALTDENGTRHQLEKRYKVLNGCAVYDE